MRKVLGGLVALLLLIPLPSLAEVPPCPDPTRPIHYLPFCLSQAEFEAIGSTATQAEVQTGLSVAPRARLEGLVAEYFPAWAVSAAVRVAGCETGWTFNPWSKNRSSGASGYFQHMPRYWSARSAAAGWAGYSIFDPEANVAVAAWLWGQTGDWRHWSCKP